MDTLLDALQEGRLFELPENDKADAMQFLAHIIEAFPDIPPGTDIVSDVLAREKAINSSIGNGWACPQAKVPFEGDLMCVVGWSPKGIDYGARDGRAVSLMVMHLVPINQRNHYLREISILAKAIEARPADVSRLERAADLNDVRNYLLDLISETKGIVGPDSRARMIKLQAKMMPEPQGVWDVAGLTVEPVTLIFGPGMQKPLVLGHNAGLVEWLDSASGVLEAIETDGFYQNGSWRIMRWQSTNFQGGRVLYKCIAMATGGLPVRKSR